MQHRAASLLLPVTLCASSAPWASAGQDPTATPLPKLIELANPTPSEKAKFGLSTCTLDFDADGVEDLAVGAPGAGRVYVFFGPRYAESTALAPEQPQAGEQFGNDIAAGDVDGEPGDELVIGAPLRTIDAEERVGAVFLVKHGAKPEMLPMRAGAGAGLGTSVAVGDFDGDGRGDVVAGAPRTDVGGEPSGAVLVYFPATEAKWRHAFSNPAGATKNGNYGHDLAVADGDGDGHDDLFVSAVGNRSSNGTPRSGQVFVHFGPFEHADAEPEKPPRMLFVEDDAPSEKDWSRFGMSIFARDVNADGCADLLVGAPRKDGGEVKDSGVGFLFLGPKYARDDPRTFVRPQAKPHDILGFRSLIADVVGGPEPDLVLSSLARSNPQALIVWDGADLDAAPTILKRPRGGSHHYIQGLSHGARIAGGRELLILGDPDYTPKDGADADGPASSGRVLLQRP